MHSAKTFFYVSLGILALAGAFHLGASTARGQATGVVASVRGNLSFRDAAGNESPAWVVTQSGDVYGWPSYQSYMQVGVPPQYLGNLFSGGPVQTQGTTWGRIKAERR